MSDNYTSIYNAIWPRLRNFDFAEAAERLGFSEPDKGMIHTSFLGRDYTIHAGGVDEIDGDGSEPIDKCLLIYYVTSKGSGEPDYTYCLPSHFLPATMSGDTLSWMSSSLIQKYKNDTTLLAKPLERLGAVYHGSHKDGNIWGYRVLPKIPIQIICVDGDDEFPCEVKILFDTGTSRFLEFEQIAFLNGAVFRTLERLSY